MRLHQSESPPSGESGLGEALFPGGNNNRENSKPLSQKQADVAWLRLQFLAGRLHLLGPNPLFYFLREIEGGADLRPTLEDYANLEPGLIAAYGDDQFALALDAWRSLRIKIGGVR